MPTIITGGTAAGGGKKDDSAGPVAVAQAVTVTPTDELRALTEARAKLTDAKGDPAARRR
jgi:hypothetical protein